MLCFCDPGVGDTEEGYFASLNSLKLYKSALASALDRGRGRTVKFSVCSKNIHRCHKARVGE